MSPITLQMPYLITNVLRLEQESNIKSNTAGISWKHEAGNQQNIPTVSADPRHWVGNTAFVLIHSDFVAFSNLALYFFFFCPVHRTNYLMWKEGKIHFPSFYPWQKILCCGLGEKNPTQTYEKAIFLFCGTKILMTLGELLWITEHITSCRWNKASRGFCSQS